MPCIISSFTSLRLVEHLHRSRQRAKVSCSLPVKPSMERSGLGCTETRLLNRWKRRSDNIWGYGRTGRTRCMHERVRMHARACSCWQRLGQSERVYSLTPEVMFQVTGACDAGRCGRKAIEIFPTRASLLSVSLPDAQILGVVFRSLAGDLRRRLVVVTPLHQQRYIFLYLSMRAEHSIIDLGCSGQPKLLRKANCFAVGNLFSMPANALLCAKCRVRAALCCSRTY